LAEQPPRTVLLEFMKDNSREQVVRDAAALRQLTTDNGQQTEQ
jgi:hypothetical protein